MYHIRVARAIQRLDAIGLGAVRPDRELVKTVHRDRRLQSLEDPRRLRRHGDSAECGGARRPPLAARRKLALLTRSLRREIPVEPSVTRALVIWRGAFHIVLRVEVRARVARTADGVHRSEDAVVPKRLEGRERRVQPEESVEVERRLRGAGHGPRNGD